MMRTAARAPGGDGRHDVGVGSGKLLPMRWSWRRRQLQKVWSGQQRPHQRMARCMAVRKPPVESSVSKSVAGVLRAVNEAMLRLWVMWSTRAEARVEGRRKTRRS